MEPARRLEPCKQQKPGDLLRKVARLTPSAGARKMRKIPGGLGDSVPQPATSAYRLQPFPKLLRRPRHELSCGLSFHCVPLPTAMAEFLVVNFRNGPFRQ